MYQFEVNDCYFKPAQSASVYFQGLFSIELSNHGCSSYMLTLGGAHAETAQLHDGIRWQPSYSIQTNILFHSVATI